MIYVQWVKDEEKVKLFQIFRNRVKNVEELCMNEKTQ